MNVHDILRHTGLVLNEDWLNNTAKDLLPYYNYSSTTSSSTTITNTNSNSNNNNPVHCTSEQQAAETILERVLREDLRICSEGSLPPNINKLHKEILPGPYLVQLEEIINIGTCTSSNNQVIDNNNSSDTTASSSYHRRCLKLALSDGKQQVYGIEYQYLSDLSINTYAGIKLLVKNIEIRRGLLLLTNQNTLILGGNVPYLSYMQEEANEFHRQQEIQPQLLPQTTTTNHNHNVPITTTITSTNIHNSHPPILTSNIEPITTIVPTSAVLTPNTANEEDIIIIDDDDDNTTIIPQTTTTNTIELTSFSSNPGKISISSWKDLLKYEQSLLITPSSSSSSSSSLTDPIIIEFQGIIGFPKDFHYTNNLYSLSVFCTDILYGNEIISVYNQHQQDKDNNNPSTNNQLLYLNHDKGKWLTISTTWIQHYLQNIPASELESILRNKDKEYKELKTQIKNMVADMEEYINVEGKGILSTLTNQYTGTIITLQLIRQHHPENNSITIEYSIIDFHS